MANAPLACGDAATGSTVGAPSSFGNGAGDALYFFSLSADVASVTFDSCGSSFDTYLPSASLRAAPDGRISDGYATLS